LKLAALIRWNHPVRGRLPPSAFLQIAEADVPTIEALTLWVVQAVAEAHHVLAGHGLAVPLSMNVSSRQLHDLTLPDRIQNCLCEGGMPVSSLCLDVTESAALDDSDVRLDILTRARLKGMSLAIDDCGTSYASLQTLQQLPCCEVKIDRAFVARVTQNGDARAVVRSIAELAAEMGLDCVADGVDTDGIAEAVEELGVTALQGDAISPPLQIDAVASWFAGWCNTAPVSLTHQRGIAPLKTVLSGLGGDASPIGSAIVFPAFSHGNIKFPPRQIQVLQLLSEGKSVKEIARHLNLGPGTIKVHLSLAYSSLGARNRVEAVNRAAPLLLAAAEGARPRSKLGKGTDC
jgi:EAL domain-containing protein (putative c-di-GMP-specific phosphodiesterase class I)/DNA-binding CsgD family transcriptional regulator